MEFMQGNIEQIMQKKRKKKWGDANNGEHGYKRHNCQ